MDDKRKKIVQVCIMLVIFLMIWGFFDYIGRHF